MCPDNLTSESQWSSGAIQNVKKYRRTSEEWQ